LILHNFRRRIPDAEFLAEFRIKFFKERFIEILNSMVFDKSGKEFLADDAIERNGSPIEDRHESKRAEFRRRSDLLEQSLDHWNAERPCGSFPIEVIFALR